MTQKRWHKIESILDKALMLEDLQAKKTWIKKYCRRDNQLCQEIIRLLKCIRKAKEENFLE